MPENNSHPANNPDSKKEETARKNSSNNLMRLLLIVGLCLCAFMLLRSLRPAANSNQQQEQQASQSLANNNTEERTPTGVSMQAERGSDELEIERVRPAGTKPSDIEDDSWTILVYLCGSDLESQNAAATQDLNEMLQGNSAQNIRFVVETGGAKTWRNNTISSKNLGRYVIQGGQMTDEGSVPAADMGEARTLSDFITWGVKNYPAEHMGLILWDHGGGSISGVCFDEINRRDSLYLRELDTALNTSFATMWDKFDFIGFDACLMSTLETANVLASYSDYMVASQESEPGNGWDYQSIAQHLSKNPSIDGGELGRAICTSYLASLDSSTKGFATLSVVDLSKIDQLMQDFYRFSQEMYESGSDQSTLAQMTRSIQQADNFGCNNRREGYTNMVDLGGLVSACASSTASATAVQTTLHDAVPYQIRGTYHADACGLSTYYPLAINGAEELSIFETIAVNPSYLSYVDRLAHGATYNGGSQYQSYSDDSFWQGNFWNWLLGNSGEVQEQTEDHWEYVDDHTETSTQISFANEPQIDEEGTFWFQFDQAGIDAAVAVSGMVYEFDPERNNYVALGETYDVYGDWETGEFADGFDGRWLSLPDGQNLNLSVEDYTDDTIVYTSPVELNGEACYLRIRQNIDDGSTVVDGVWGAIGENGALDRSARSLKKGDVIMPLYSAISANEGTATTDYAGNTYTLTSDTLTVEYEQLPAGTYMYSFYITDVFGDTYFTPSAQFDIDTNGDIYFA